MKMFEIYKEASQKLNKITTDFTISRRNIMAYFSSEYINITIKRDTVIHNLNLTYNEAEDLAVILNEMMVKDYANPTT